MCGVIYFKGDVREYRQLIISLFKESRIRGLHAFGMAIKPERAEEAEWMVGRYFQLESAYRLMDAHEGNVEIFGHTRYDTSGDWKVIGNNQPIEVKNNLLVFNGVVRMSTKKEYEKEFRHKYKTANDGEIPLQMWSEGDHEGALALLREEQVSFAGVFRVDGRSFALRNPRRPLWYWVAPGATFVCSTKDIWSRATRKVASANHYSDPDFLEQVPPLEVLWL